MPTVTIVNVSRHNLDFAYRTVIGGELRRLPTIPVGGDAEIYCNDESEAFAVQKSLEDAGAVEGRVMLAEHDKAWMMYSWGDISEETAIDAAEHNVKAEAVISAAATEASKEEAADANSEIGFDLDVSQAQQRGRGRPAKVN